MKCVKILGWEMKKNMVTEKGERKKEPKKRTDFFLFITLTCQYPKKKKKNGQINRVKVSSTPGFTTT
jgi:hypothetical protein